MIGDTTTGTIDAANYNVGLGVDVFAALTSGDYNVAVGTSSLFVNTTGSNNTAVGRNALVANTTGSANIAIGSLALGANTEASNNIAVGKDALGATTTGAGNTAVGSAALYLNTTASNNTAVGLLALAANTTASYNTAVGASALAANTTGTNNQAYGQQALDQVTNGSQNIGIGNGTGSYLVNLTTGSGNILIGHVVHTTTSGTNYATGVGYNLSCAGGYTTLGQDSTDIRAQHGVATWATVSDERYKKDIADSTTGLSFINALQPRTFKYKTLGELPETFNAYEADSTEVFKNSNTNHGFIAQEVKAAIDADDSIKDGFRLWDDREDGSQEVAEAALIPVLVKAIQELSAEVETLKSQIGE